MFHKCLTILQSNSIPHCNEADFDGNIYISVNLPTLVPFKGTETDYVTVYTFDSEDTIKHFLKIISEQFEKELYSPN